jgi:hypothetical protein
MMSIAGTADRNLGPRRPLATFILCIPLWLVALPHSAWRRAATERATQP